MAEKRKGRKRREEEDLLPQKEVKEKPLKTEYEVAKWLRSNLQTKKTKFLNHNVEYFTGSKAVDALLESNFAKTVKGKPPLFSKREEIVWFLNDMLRHNFFHRAKKIPVSEQELKAKLSKKKDKKVEEEKKKEEENAENSQAEGKKPESEGEQQQKKKYKIRLDMHFEQVFKDNLDAYVWIYEHKPLYYWICGALIVLGTIGICLFPLWPLSFRLCVQYLSIAAAGFLVLIILLTLFRLVIFSILWLLTMGSLQFWLFPNLTEDVGFFASFWPIYQYTITTKPGENNKKKDKDKNSDDERDSDKNDSSKEKDNDSESSESEDTKSQSLEKQDGSETESESSSQQSQTGKDFEIVDKEDAENDKKSS